MTPALGPRWRRVLLSGHIVVSVGWIGAAAAYLALSVAATNGEVVTIRAAWIGMALIGWFIIVPAAVLTLVTGVWLSLGTAWGLLRHYWVVIALVLTVLSAVVLLLHMPDVTAGMAVARAGDDPAVVALGGDVVHPALGSAVLLVVAVLNVHKPRGLTRYGVSKQAEDSRRTRRPSAAPNPEPTSPGGRFDTPVDHPED